MKKKKIIILDTYSQLPKEIFDNVQASKRGKILLQIVGEESAKMGQRKVNAHKEGFEFLPEYYEFAEQINIPLSDFRNYNYIQKDFGFRKQKDGEPIQDFIRENGHWVMIEDESQIKMTSGTTKNHTSEDISKMNN